MGSRLSPTPFFALLAAPGTLPALSASNPLEPELQREPGTKMIRELVGVQPPQNQNGGEV